MKKFSPPLPPLFPSTNKTPVLQIPDNAPSNRNRKRKVHRVPHPKTPPSPFGLNRAELGKPTAADPRDEWR